MNGEKIIFSQRFLPLCVCVSLCVFQLQGGFWLSGEGGAVHVPVGGYRDGRLGEPAGDGGRVQGQTTQVRNTRKPHGETWVGFQTGELGSELIISIIVCSYERGKKIPENDVWKIE